MAGERNTVQREVILQAVRSMHSHPTADEVYAYISEEYPSISKATVYRNLNTLARAGKVFHVPMPDGADCYDHRTDAHYHIRCMSCKKIFDARFIFGKELTEAAQAQEPDFLITDHVLTFTGICPACRQAGAALEE